MSTPGSINQLLIGAAGAAGGGYEIPRSLRFNSADSAHLSRTPGSAGNRKTWTWAGWVKASTSDVARFFAGENGSGHRFYIDLSSGNLRVGHNNGTWNIILNTTQVFRDFSAWFHLLVAVDTTQATAANRVKIYTNGEQITSFSSSTYPAQNLDTIVNESGASLYQGFGGTANGSGYLNGYLADIHFIDGQALDPTSFGKSDTNGVWQPIEYAGTYGTNGFHLPFSDNSTAAALGTDTSGNGNDWTVNNITAVSPSLSNPSNNNTPVYQVTIGPTNPTSGVDVWSNAFDADTNTYGIIGPITFTGTKPTWSTSQGVELMAAGNGITASVNGGTQIALTNNVFVTISSGSSGTLNSIWIYNSAGSSSIRSVRVDGVDISVQALIGTGAEQDSLVDTPTSYGTDTGAGGEVRGNYATLNPLAKTISSGVSSDAVVENGNLFFRSPGTYRETFPATIAIAGKTYFEGHVSAASSSYWQIGLLAVDQYKQSLSNVDLKDYGANCFTWYASNGNVYVGSSLIRTTTTPGADAIVGLAFDPSTGDVYGYINGSVQNSGNPIATLSTSKTYIPAFLSARNDTDTWVNFGQRPFAYTAPSGYKALCTTNLPDPVVAQPSTVMDVALDSGANILTATKALCGGNANFLWIKDRVNGSTNHHLIDIVRDPQLDGTPFLASNSTSNETTLGTYSAPSGNSVGWAWYAGTTTASNPDGSITSSVRANPSAGFSIVTYTGNATPGATVGHGLGVAPSFVIQKDRDGLTDWQIFHAGAQTSGALQLRFTINPATSDISVWNNTAPSSSVITLGNGDTNRSGNDQIIYAFAPVAGYSSFGSYTGNGSADGPFVYTGFRPRWILCKQATGVDRYWQIHDSSRNEYNVTNIALYPDQSFVESVTGAYDFLSNGFKLRSSASTTLNGSGETYIYAAFAESPFQYARAR